MFECHLLSNDVPSLTHVLCTDVEKYAMSLQVMHLTYLVSVAVYADSRSILLYGASS
jgi:hypothetical protein